MNHLSALKALPLLALICAGGATTSCAGKSSDSFVEFETESSFSSETIVSDIVSTETENTNVNTMPYEKNGIHFSAVSGFYDNEFYLEITSIDGTTVYYTLDGSDPTTAAAPNGRTDFK